MSVNEEERLVILHAICQDLLREAEKRKLDAGYSGSWDDGGASRIRADVDFFLAGLNKRVPSDWTKRYEKAEIEFLKRKKENAALEVAQQDPDYERWVELNKKFSHIRGD